MGLKRMLCKKKSRKRIIAAVWQICVFDSNISSNAHFIIIKISFTLQVSDISDLGHKKVVKYKPLERLEEWWVKLASVFLEHYIQMHTRSLYSYKKLLKNFMNIILLPK